MNLSEVAVVIPAYNEESSLPLVLRDLPMVDQVIVANNGSTDRTADVAEAAETMVVTETRRGYGAACLAGLEELRRQVELNEPAPQIVAFVDADYSDHPDQFARIARSDRCGRS